MANQPYGADLFPKELAAKYELVDWVGGHRQFFGKFGEINLTTLTEAQAERLVNKGFKKIRRKDSPKPSAEKVGK